MKRSEEAIRLAHMAVNPDTARRLVADHGAGGALSRLRRRDTTPQAAREGAGTSAEARSSRLEELGVEMVFDEEPGYPEWLRDLPDHPLWLFVKGTLPASPGVAVVGSRRATRYGLDLARDIGRRVGAAGWDVVSGLAAGVDTMSHVGCLDAGGATTAVLGSGIDVWYPRGNKRLGERIMGSEGCVVSEFPPRNDSRAMEVPIAQSDHLGAGGGGDSRGGCRAKRRADHGPAGRGTGEIRHGGPR